MDDSVVAFLDGVRRTHLCAGRFIAVPADIRGGSNALATFDEIEVDHRLSTVSLALLAGLQTGAASDAARRIDVKLVPEHYVPPCEAPLRCAGRSSADVSGLALRLILQAETLNSGILLRGSSVRWVKRFALRVPAQ